MNQPLANEAHTALLGDGIEHEVDLRPESLFRTVSPFRRAFLQVLNIEPLALVAAHQGTKGNRQVGRLT
jgi:hypothetical protein